MPEDSGAEPMPPGRAAASRVAGAPPEPRVFRPAPFPDARFPDAPLLGPLFPAALPLLPRLRLSACRRPATGGPGTEGDWLDVFVLPDGATALVTGHVEGARGPAGAAGAAGAADAVAARLRASLRDLLRGGAAPAEALARLDAAAGTPGGRGAAVCLAVLNPLTGDLRYATAGQPRPVICPAAGDDGYRPGPVPGSPGPGRRAGRPESGTAVLPPGAVLLLYRDGPAGAARLVADTASSILAGGGSAAAADLADQVGRGVLARLTSDAGAGPATVLAAHRLRAPVDAWSMNVPGDPLALRQLRMRLRDWLHELGASPSDRTDVELAVWEAAVNAVLHGRPVAGAARVTVRAALDDAGRAVIQVTDRGRWRPPGRPEPGRGWPGGHGLQVIRQAADEVDIAPGPDGTTVTVRRFLSRPVPGQAQPGEYPATAAHPGTRA